MTGSSFCLVVLVGALVPAASGVAVEPAADSPAERYRLEALRAEQPIELDGYLDEPAWERAPVASGFTQREPMPGEPATERTEVRVVTTSRLLYVGVRAFDQSPESIIAREMRRDGRLRNDDSFIILLDTFDDDRNAYFLETNPNGARTDALITDEGRDFNFEWDGVWDVKARRTGDGWTAEIVIPFSTLRFDARGKTWGLNFRRLIRRKNEEVYWAPILLDADSQRVSLYGALEGIAGIDPGLNLNLKPFVTGGSSDSKDAAASDGENLDGGIDVKWGITKAINLDLTLNTDFAETEVDDQRVNLTRFSLFFPEKREFFLENAGIFDFGPASSGRGAPLLKVFFSRRIGLKDGNEVPMDWGLRLTGRVGQWNFGLLDVETGSVSPTAVADSEGEAATLEEEDSGIPSNSWRAIRLKRNVGQRSSVGLIATERSGPRGDFNRVWGADFDFKLTSQLAFTGFFTQSDDPDLAAGDDQAFGLQASWEGDVWEWEAQAVQVDERFEPEMGFLLRRDVRRYAGEVSFEPRPTVRGVRHLIFELEGEVFTDLDGEVESEEFELTPFGLRFSSEDRISFYVERKFERLEEPFEIVSAVVIAPGEYRFYDYGISYSLNESRRVAVSGFVQTGEFFDGDRSTWRVSLRVRPNRFLNSETTWDVNDVSLPAGDFKATILRQRLGLSWNPRIRTDALIQYNDLAEDFGVNVRFNWIYKPGADLFVVFNQNWDAPGLSDLDRRDRQLIVKFTYLFQR